MWTSFLLAEVISLVALTSVCWATASTWPSMISSRGAAATSGPTSTSRRAFAPWVRNRNWMWPTDFWGDVAVAGRISRLGCAVITRLLWWASGWILGKCFFVCLSDLNVTTALLGAPTFTMSMKNLLSLSTNKEVADRSINWMMKSI